MLKFSHTHSAPSWQQEMTKIGHAPHFITPPQYEYKKDNYDKSSVIICIRKEDKQFVTQNHIFVLMKKIYK